MSINIIDNGSFFSFFTIRNGFLRVGRNEKDRWITLERRRKKEEETNTTRATATARRERKNITTES
jgi:hypothetical protein